MNEKILIEPHVTEKTIRLTESKKYTFKVANFANKPEIILALKKIYNVNPIEVHVINQKGKNMVYRSRYKGKCKNWKKAVITLPSKESIKEFAVK